MNANPGQAFVPEDEVLRLDYEKTNGYIELLADIRFKLLAIVPTITGASIAILTINGNNAESASVLGIFGLSATIGIYFMSCVIVSCMMQLYTGQNILSVC